MNHTFNWNACDPKYCAMENQILKRDFFFGLVDATCGRWVIQNKCHKTGRSEISRIHHSVKYRRLVKVMVTANMMVFVELTKGYTNEEKGRLFALRRRILVSPLLNGMTMALCMVH